MIVRLKSHEFRPHVEQVVRRFSGYLASVNLDTLSALWCPSIDAGIGVAFADSNGFLLGLFITDPISGEKQAVQCLWMMAPGCRSNRAALNLFSEFESEARLRKCNRITSGCMIVSNIPKMRRLYKAMGYSVYSESFCKVLRPVNNESEVVHV